MNKDAKKQQEKIIFFPGLVDKLVEKGMGALKAKDVSEAFAFFKQALTIEEDHFQARFGIALCYIEQNKLQEAKEVTEKMLREDIGDYYDIVQVHISLLVQLGEYGEVVTMLEGILIEEKLPAGMAESFYHLLHFSRQMVEDVSVPAEREDTRIPLNAMKQMLSEASIEKQLVAIQLLGRESGEIFFEAVKDFLASEQGDLVLKSMILQVLKEKKINKTIEIHKLGTVVHMNAFELENIFHEKFGKDALAVVAAQLETENPSLYEMAEHICWHYLFAIYPLSPEPLDSGLWAAAIHRTALTMSGIETDDLTFEEIYQVDLGQLHHCVEKILVIEQATFKEGL